MSNFGLNNASVPPDPEIIYRQYLLDQTAITDLVSTRIATRLPQSPTLPFIVIRNGGSAFTNPASQVGILSTTMIANCYAGRWGGDGTKSEPDYTTASNVAQALFKNLHNAGSAFVETSGGTKAKIYGFELASGPARIEEDELLIANFELIVEMTYRHSE